MTTPDAKYILTSSKGQPDFYCLPFEAAVKALCGFMWITVTDELITIQICTYIVPFK